MIVFVVGTSRFFPNCVSTALEGCTLYFYWNNYYDRNIPYYVWHLSSMKRLNSTQCSLVQLCSQIWWYNHKKINWGKLKKRLSLVTHTSYTVIQSVMTVLVLARPFHSLWTHIGTRVFKNYPADKSSLLGRNHNIKKHLS